MARTYLVTVNGGSFFGTAALRSRKTVAIGRVILARDQRREVTAAGLGDLEAVRADEVAGHLALDVGDLRQRCLAGDPAIRRVRLALDRHHHARLAGNGELHRCLAHGVRLLHVGGAGDVASGAHEVIGHRVVMLVLELVADHLREHRRQAPELGMTERVLASGFGQELARRGADTLACDDRARTELLHAGVNGGQELVLVEHDLGEQDHLRCVAFLFARQAARGRGPAGVSSHHLEDEDLGRGLGHARDVEAGLADRHRRVLGHRSEARTAVRERQVVVHRLGHVDRLHRIAQRLAELADLQAGVGAVAAPVVEERADVVRAKDLDQTLVLRAVLVEALELVTAGAERPSGRVAQRGDRGIGLLRRVDQVLGQRADDAVASRVDLAEVLRVLARRLDHALRRYVDHGGHATGLGVEDIARHGTRSDEGLGRCIATA